MLAKVCSRETDKRLKQLQLPIGPNEQEHTQPVIFQLAANTGHIVVHLARMAQKSLFCS